ncbi:hypothetical protein, partial [Plesiomonas shigelloides]
FTLGASVFECTFNKVGFTGSREKEPWLKWIVQTKQYVILNGVELLRRQGQIRATIYFNIGE